MRDRKAAKIKGTKPELTNKAIRIKLDAMAVLAMARRVSWDLQIQGVHIDREAASAITTGRHGPEGAAFAQRILAKLGGDVDEQSLRTAIEAALVDREHEGRI